jgi:hypothetical protein
MRFDRKSSKGPLRPHRGLLHQGPRGVQITASWVLIALNYSGKKGYG